MSKKWIWVFFVLLIIAASISYAAVSTSQEVVEQKVIDPFSQDYRNSTTAQNSSNSSSGTSSSNETKSIMISGFTDDYSNKTNTTTPHNNSTTISGPNTTNTSDQTSVIKVYGANR